MDAATENDPPHNPVKIRLIRNIVNEFVKEVKIYPDPVQAKTTISTYFRRITSERYPIQTLPIICAMLKPAHIIPT
jgi:hypothetical protein